MEPIKFNPIKSIQYFGTVSENILGRESKKERNKRRSPPASQRSLLPLPSLSNCKPIGNRHVIHGLDLIGSCVILQPILSLVPAIRRRTLLCSKSLPDHRDLAIRDGSKNKTLSSSNHFQRINPFQ